MTCKNDLISELPSFPVSYSMDVLDITRELMLIKRKWLFCLKRQNSVFPLFRFRFGLELGLGLGLEFGSGLGFGLGIGLGLFWHLRQNSR